MHNSELKKVSLIIANNSLIKGQFGDGKLDTVRPVTLSVIDDVQLVTDEGQVNAKVN